MRRLQVGVGLVVSVALGGCILRSGEPAGSGDFVNIPGIGSTRIDVPRPSGVASAACDDDPLPPISDAAIADRVRELREIGLFASRPAPSDAELAAEVEAAISEQWGTLDAAGPMLDLAVAEQDRTRVWWRDLEADVVGGNEVYAQMLADWGEISAGAFEPKDIVETWDGEEGPITVEFVHGGTSHTVTPGFLEDWIDPGIVVALNDVIADSGRRFELYKAFDQTALVMALTDEERRALEARGWCFE